MKTLGHGHYFKILTAIAGLDLVAAVATDIPGMPVFGILAACLVLMMLDETGAATPRRGAASLDGKAADAHGSPHD